MGLLLSLGFSYGGLIFNHLGPHQQEFIAFLANDFLTYFSLFPKIHGTLTAHNPDKPSLLLKAQRQKSKSLQPSLLFTNYALIFASNSMHKPKSLRC